MIGDDQAIDERWLALDGNGEILGEITELPEGPILKASAGRLYQLAETDTGEQVIDVFSYRF